MAFYAFITIVNWSDEGLCRTERSDAPFSREYLSLRLEPSHLGMADLN